MRFQIAYRNASLILELWQDISALMSFVLKKANTYLLKVIPFFLLLLLTSCFELQEEVAIQKDGSGHYKMILDFSAHKEMIQELLNTADTSKSKPFGKEGLDKLTKTWTEGAVKLNKINGITNAFEIADEQNFRYGFSFDFSDIEALNLALATYDSWKFTETPELAFVYHGKGKFKKNNVFVYKRLFEKLLEETENQPKYLQTQKKAIFAQISYKCTLITEGKIKKKNHPGFKFDRNKHRLVYKCYLKEIYDEIVDIGIELKFK